MPHYRYVTSVLLLALLLAAHHAVDSKKSLQDYSDSDLERLYDEWEDNDDDPLPLDEQPPWKQPPPKEEPIDLSKLSSMDPEDIAKATKKGKTLMAFVAMKGKPNPRELDDMTEVWEQGLKNMHIEVQRFIIDEKRAIFMFTNGLRAYEAKDFLIEQEACESVAIEGKMYTAEHPRGYVENSKHNEL